MARRANAVARAQVAHAHAGKVAQAVVHGCSAAQMSSCVTEDTTSDFLTRLAIAESRDAQRLTTPTTSSRSRSVHSSESDPSSLSAMGKTMTPRGLHTVVCAVAPSVL